MLSRSCWTPTSTGAVVSLFSVSVIPGRALLTELLSEVIGTLFTVACALTAGCVSAMPYIVPALLA